MGTACGVQTKERQRAEAKRKAAEAAAEAKQEADIAAYHACLRHKEAHRHHQPSQSREDQPAGLLQGPVPGSDEGSHAEVTRGHAGPDEGLMHGNSLAGSGVGSGAGLLEATLCWGLMGIWKRVGWEMLMWT